MMRRSGLLVMGFLLLFGAAAFLCTPARADEKSALDHPAIKEILVMVEAGVGDRVIFAKLKSMDSIPVLSGAEIAQLKEKGFGDALLESLVLMGGSNSVPVAGKKAGSMPAAAAAATSARLSVATPGPEALPEGAAKIRVLLNSSFRISYYEVIFDGRKVAERGAILEGRSGPGEVLARADFFRLKKDELVFEQIVPAGRHELLVGYALSEVDGNPEDPFNEYSREKYVSRGVRAEEKAATSGAWGVNHAAVCEPAAGETCTITATFKKLRSRIFGGVSVPAVKYKVH